MNNNPTLSDETPPVSGGFSQRALDAPIPSDETQSVTGGFPQVVLERLRTRRGAIGAIGGAAVAGTLLSLVLIPGAPLHRGSSPTAARGVGGSGGSNGQGGSGSSGGGSGNGSGGGSGQSSASPGGGSGSNASGGGSSNGGQATPSAKPTPSISVQPPKDGIVGEPLLRMSNCAMGYDPGVTCTVRYQGSYYLASQPSGKVVITVTIDGSVADTTSYDAPPKGHNYYTVLTFKVPQHAHLIVYQAYLRDNSGKNLSQTQPANTYGYG